MLLDVLEREYRGDHHHKDHHIIRAPPEDSPHAVFFFRDCRYEQEYEEKQEKGITTILKGSEPSLAAIDSRKVRLSVGLESSSQQASRMQVIIRKLPVYSLPDRDAESNRNPALRPVQCFMPALVHKQSDSGVDCDQAYQQVQAKGDPHLHWHLFVAFISDQ